MTDEQALWFCNGAGWLLVVLRDMGIDVDEEKLIEFLKSLADGSVSRTPSPEELAMGLERETGEPVSDDFLDDLRKDNPARRRRTAATDRKAAGVILRTLYAVQP